MATRKDVDNALGLLNCLFKRYKFSLSDEGLLYKKTDSTIFRNIRISNTTKSNIVDVIWAMIRAMNLQEEENSP